MKVLYHIKIYLFKSLLVKLEFNLRSQWTIPRMGQFPERHNFKNKTIPQIRQFPERHNFTNETIPRKGQFHERDNSTKYKQECKP